MRPGSIKFSIKVKVEIDVPHLSTKFRISSLDALCPSTFASFYEARPLALFASPLPCPEILLPTLCFHDDQIKSAEEIFIFFLLGSPEDT